MGSIRRSAASGTHRLFVPRTSCRYYDSFDDLLLWNHTSYQLLLLLLSLTVAVQSPTTLKKDVDILVELKGLGIVGAGTDDSHQKEEALPASPPGSCEGPSSANAREASMIASTNSISYVYILPDLSRHRSWVKRQALLETHIHVPSSNGGSNDDSGTKRPSEDAKSDTTGGEAEEDGILILKSDGEPIALSSDTTPKRQRAPQVQVASGDSQQATSSASGHFNALRTARGSLEKPVSVFKKRKVSSSQPSVLFQKFGVHSDGTRAIYMQSEREDTRAPSTSETTNASFSTKKNSSVEQHKHPEEDILPDRLAEKVGGSVQLNEKAQLEDQIQQTMRRMNQDIPKMLTGTQNTEESLPAASQNSPLLQMYGLMSNTQMAPQYLPLILNASPLMLGSPPHLKSSGLNSFATSLGSGPQSSSLLQHLGITNTLPVDNSQLLNSSMPYMQGAALAQGLLQQDTHGQASLLNPQQLLRQAALTLNPFLFMNANLSARFTNPVSAGILPRLLYLEGDEEKLSTYQVALRQQIEGTSLLLFVESTLERYRKTRLKLISNVLYMICKVFVATEEDVEVRKGCVDDMTYVRKCPCLITHHSSSLTTPDLPRDIVPFRHIPVALQ